MKLKQICRRRGGCVRRGICVVVRKVERQSQHLTHSPSAFTETQACVQRCKPACLAIHSTHTTSPSIKQIYMCRCYVKKSNTFFLATRTDTRTYIQFNIHMHIQKVNGEIKQFLYFKLFIILSFFTFWYLIFLFFHWISWSLIYLLSCRQLCKYEKKFFVTWH